MKKIYFWLAAILCCFSSSFAQTTAAIGAGGTVSTSSNSGPIYRSSAGSGFDYSQHTYLFTAAELASIGIVNGTTISEIAWNKSGTGATVATNTSSIWQVYMKNSATAPGATWSSSSFATQITGATQVYNNSAQAIPAAAGYIPLTIASPFTYTGGSLEVGVNWNCSAFAGSPTTGSISWLTDALTNQVFGGSNSAAAMTMTLQTVRPQTRFTFTPPPCAGTPIIGGITSSVMNGCAGIPFSLNLTGLSNIGNGVTYQWQSSPAGANTFTNLGAAQTSPSYIVASQTSATDYQCIVTCANGGGMATSSIVAVGQNTFMNCYCVTSPTTGGVNDIITNVTMGTLNNTTTFLAPAYFTSYSNTPVDLSQGTNQNISITFGTDGTQHSAVWIDFNQNGIYETSENVALSTAGAGGSATVVYALAVPMSATLGQTKMRVRGGSDLVYTAAGACTASQYGETEDYLVNIVAPPSCLAPLTLANSAVTTTAATHTWTAPSPAPASGYEWAVTTSSTPPASGTTEVGLTANSTGLMANTLYYLHVRSNCGSGFSAWSTSPSFFTGYCASNSTSGTSFINDLTTTGGSTDISNLASGYSAGGYGDFTGQIVSQTQGAVVNVSGVMNGAPADDGVAIYVDYNDNLTFETTEKVYTSLSYVAAIAASFTVPASAPAGNHRMRIVINYNSTDPAACGTITRGETEDYTLNVIVAPPCVGPINGGTATNTTNLSCAATTTVLNASGTSAGTGITLQWESSPAGANTFTPISGATTVPFTTASITASTDFRLVVTCANGPAVGTSSITSLVINAVVANDAVCNAIPLILDGATDCGNTTCATATGNEPATFSQSALNNTNWYSFTPTTTGVFEVNFSRPSGITTGLLNGWLGIFSTTGTCPGALTFTEVSPITGLNFNLTTSATVTLVTPTLAAGTTYYFMTDGVSGAFGAYCINIKTPPPPPNCTTNISPVNGATGVAFSPNMVLSWNAAPTATSYDVYFGTTNPPTTLIGNTPSTTVNVTGGLGSTTYYWYIAPRNAGGAATGCVTSVFSYETILTCDAPTTVATNTVTSTTANVTFVGGGSAFIVEYGATGFTPGTGATAGVGGTIVTGASSPIALTGLTVSTAYQVYVRQDCTVNSLGFSSNSTVASFTTTAPPPTNDEATGAISLTVGGGCVADPYTNVAATQSLGEPFPNCEGTAGFAGMWYSFVAPASGSVKISCDGTGTLGDTRMALFAATNPADYTTFSIISCDDDNGITNGNRSLFYAAGLTPGTTYYIDVDLFGSGSTRGTYCIAVDELAASMISTTAVDCSSDGGVTGLNATYTGWSSLVDAVGNLNANVRQTAGTTTGYSSFKTIKTGAPRVAVSSGLPYMNRNFTINAADVTTADLQLFFTDAEVTNLGTALNLLQVSRVPGTVCTPNIVDPDAVLAQTASGSANGVSFVQVSTPGFSNFFVRGVAGPLPVAVEYIKGTKQGKVNVIDWKISCSQTASVIIDLERSNDSRSFRSINTENATALRCDQPFDYTDANPAAGINYYRLKLTTPDGVAKYSTIVALTSKEKGFELISVAPNPVRDNAILTLASAKAGRIEIVITDVVGKVVAKQVNTVISGSNPINMNFANLAAGTYNITAVNADGEVKVTRFVKY